MDRQSVRIAGANLKQYRNLGLLQTAINTAYPEAEAAILFHWTKDRTLQECEVQAKAGVNLQEIIKMIESHEVSEEESDEAILTQKKQRREQMNNLQAWVNLSEWKQQVEARLIALEQKVG